MLAAYRERQLVRPDRRERQEFMPDQWAAAPRGAVLVTMTTNVSARGATAGRLVETG